MARTVVRRQRVHSLHSRVVVWYGMRTFCAGRGSFGTGRQSLMRSFCITATHSDDPLLVWYGLSPW